MLVKRFAADENIRSHVFYRFFNEVPVIILNRCGYSGDRKAFLTGKMKMLLLIINSPCPFPSPKPSPGGEGRTNRFASFTLKIPI